jgi:hypothetical protein
MMKFSFIFRHLIFLAVKITFLSVKIFDKLEAQDVDCSADVLRITAKSVYPSLERVKGIEPSW